MAMLPYLFSQGKTGSCRASTTVSIVNKFVLVARAASRGGGARNTRAEPLWYGFRDNLLRHQHSLVLIAGDSLQKRLWPHDAFVRREKSAGNCLQGDTR